MTQVDLRRLAGLAPDDEISLEKRIELEPDDEVAWGRSDLALGLLLAGSTAFGNLEDAGEGVRIAAHVEHARVVLVDEASHPVPLFGSTQELDGSVVLDARVGLAVARCISPEGEHLVVVDRDEVSTYRIERAPTQLEEALASWRPPDAPDLQVPPPETKGQDTWLRERADLLASGYLLQRVAALGLVQRLAHPPADIPVEWVDAVLIEDEALRATSALRERLQRLQAPASERLARSLIERRDELQSVHAVLHRVSAGDELLVALAALDLVAEAQLSLLSSPALVDDPWLSTVSWKEPDAWWGLLVQGS